MTTAKERVRNFFVGCGKFIRVLIHGGKLVAHDISEYRRQVHEEERVKNQVRNQARRYYERIEEEGRAYGRGVARGMAEVREQERARREDERALKQYFNEYPRSAKKVFNGDFLTEDLQPKKRKKKRSMFNF
jgi:hypothetical protein